MNMLLPFLTGIFIGIIGWEKFCRMLEDAYDKGSADHMVDCTDCPYTISHEELVKKLNLSQGVGTASTPDHLKNVIAIH